MVGLQLRRSCTARRPKGQPCCAAEQRGAWRPEGGPACRCKAGAAAANTNHHMHRQPWEGRRLETSPAERKDMQHLGASVAVLAHHTKKCSRKALEEIATFRMLPKSQASLRGRLSPPRAGQKALAFLGMISVLEDSQEPAPLPLSKTSRSKAAGAAAPCQRQGLRQARNQQAGASSVDGWRHRIPAANLACQAFSVSSERHRSPSPGCRPQH